MNETETKCLETFPEWLRTLTGSSADTEDNIEAALRHLVTSARERAMGCRDIASTPLLRRSGTCVRCDQPTSIDGLAGQHTCLLCFAQGGRGLSNLDLNHLLVTGVLCGKGVPRRLHPPALCSVTERVYIHF